MRLLKSTNDITTFKNVVQQITKKSENMPRILLDKEFEINLINNKSKFYFLLDDSKIQAYYLTIFYGQSLQGFFFFSKNKKLEEEYFYKICQQLIEDYKGCSCEVFRFISVITPIKNLADRFIKDGFTQLKRNLMILELNKFNDNIWQKYNFINDQDYVLKTGMNEEISEIANLILLSEKEAKDAQFYPEMQIKETFIEIMGFKTDRIKQYENTSTKLLYANNKLIGINLISIINTDSAYIAQLAVHPNFRNKKLGTYLMLESIQTIKKKGIKKIRLHVAKENYSAKHLYEKLGFIDKQTRTIFSRCNIL